MEGVEIREAVATDKVAVLAIQENVYGGLDYLDALYDDFIKCPHSTPYVLVYNNDIVSFATAFLIDDGNTVISRGGRTKDKWTGQGFYKMLTQHCLKTSGARFVAFAADNTNKAIHSASFKKENKHILSRPILRFNVDAKSLQVKPSGTSSSVANLTKSQLEFFMSSEAHRQYLFPDDRLIINWVPFRLLSSNVPLLWTREETSLRLSDVRCYKDAMEGLLTFATAYSGTGGMLVVHIDIYGTNLCSLKYHLEAHMDFAHMQGDGPTVILVYCEPSIMSTVVKTFREYDIEETVWELNFQSIFEKLL